MAGDAENYAIVTTVQDKKLALEQGIAKAKKAAEDALNSLQSLGSLHADNLKLFYELKNADAYLRPACYNKEQELRAFNAKVSVF
jgi:hypothetical protein